MDAAHGPDGIRPRGDVAAAATTSMSTASGARALTAAALAASPLWFVFGILAPRASQELRLPSYDFYAYFYPNVLYAGHGLEQGFGLFWNPYQNCGQPFFALSLTALLYPPSLIFHWLDRETALMLSMVLHLAFGGLGAWLLFREMRLHRVAALAGAVAFQVGAPTLLLTAWGPMHIGPWVWLPWALFAVERLLRQPTHRRGALLAVILALQLLPGFPLPSLFTVQLVLARVVLALVRGEVGPGRLALPLAIGLGAVPLLVAVQYLPSLGVALDSVRAPGLGRDETIRHDLLVFRPGLCAAMLAAAALPGGSQRALTWFWASVAVFFGLLSLGDATPLFDLYRALPLGDLFVRAPRRFLWVSAFALSVLARRNRTRVGCARLVSRRCSWRRSPSSRLLPEVWGAGSGSPVGSLSLSRSGSRASLPMRNVPPSPGR
jgi:hypothetical protein